MIDGNVSIPIAARKSESERRLRLTRRSLLAGVTTGVAQMLFHKQLNASRVSTLSAARRGKLNLRLSAISPQILHFAIAPATAPAHVEDCP